MWNKDLTQYTVFCEKYQAEIPIFYQPWWLDAVCTQGDWLPFISDDGLAVCPIYVKSKWGLKYITMPPLTYKLGVWAAPTAEAYNYTIVGVLNGLSSRFIYVLQNVPYNEIALSELKEFEIDFEEYFHYMHGLLSDEASLLSRINKDAKRNLKKAQHRGLLVDVTSNCQLLFNLFSMSLGRHNYLNSLEESTVQSLWNQCAKRNCGEIKVALDVEGNVHASQFVAWNNKTIYFVMSGIDNRIKQAGGNRLIHESILKTAANSNRNVDLCGGMSPNFASVFSSMGAEKQPYIHIEHYPNVFVKNIIKWAKKIKNLAY